MRTCLRYLPIACLAFNIQAQEDKPVLMDMRIPGKDRDWRVVNDGVMGGLSEGRVTTETDHVRFSGVLSLENNGGFASMRTDRDFNLKGSSGVRLRVRGDGRTYQVRFQTDRRFRRNWPVSYSGEFRTEKGVWTEVVVPFGSLKQSFRGRELSGYDFDPAKIQLFGILLADKKPGAFCLDVQWVRAESEAD